MHIQFWLNTFLSGVVPGGYGYSRTLRKHRNSAYNHDRDKKAVRKKHHGQGGWQTEERDGFRYRDYASYQEYVEHQKTKFDEIIEIHGGLTARQIVKYRLNFFDRFRLMRKFLPPEAKILCAGARQGTEVEVLRELGFFNAYGIDLNPGPSNPLVRVGDFLNLDVPDGELDLIYTNAVDHAFDLDKLFGEHARAVGESGYAYYDIALQEGGPFESVHWASDELVFKKMLKYFRSVEFVRVDSARQWKSILLKGGRKP